MASPTELARDILLSLIAKSGVREWDDPEARTRLTTAASEMAAAIWLNSEGDLMALPDYGRIQSGTEKTFKSASGSADITMTSVATDAARQSTKCDFGATRATRYEVFAEVEMAATPTADKVIELWLNPSSSATAGTDNLGGCSGTDAAYSGYSSNLAVSVKQLLFVGELVVTAQATATVQKGFVGFVTIPQRYASLVVYNKSGAAFHSSATNIVFRFVPIEDVTEDT